MCPVLQVGHCAVGTFRTLIRMKCNHIHFSVCHLWSCFFLFYRNCADVCDCNGGSSLVADFHGLVYHQQHQTGDCPTVSLNFPLNTWFLPVWYWWFLPAWIKIQNEESVILFLVVWTLTEITRYSYYTFKLLHHLPFFIKWARWSNCCCFCVFACCCWSKLTSCSLCIGENRLSR